MGMQALEQRLERMVDGVFRRSRNSIRPIELGRRLIREMDDHRTVDVKGQRVVPNDFHDPARRRRPRRFRRHRGRAAHRTRRGRPRVRPRGGLPLHGPGRRRPARRQLAQARPVRHHVPDQAGRGGPASRHDRDAVRRPDRAQRRPQPDRSPVRLPDRDHRRQHQPPPRRDPPIWQRVRHQRPGLHQRHLPQRRTTHRRPPASTTATSSRSARSASASKPPEPTARSPPTSQLHARLRPRHPQARAAGMLYLFFARVLFAVWSEVRQPAQRRGHVEQPPPCRLAPAPAAERREVKPMKGRGTRAGPARRARAEAASAARPTRSTALIGIGRERRQHDPDRGRHATSPATTPRCRAADGRVMVDDLALAQRHLPQRHAHHRAAHRQGRRPDPDRLHRVRGAVIDMLTRTR